MIQLSIVFNNRSKPLKSDGTGPIQIRAYYQQKKKLFSTGLYVAPAHWNAKKQQVVNCEKATHYNAEARRQLSELESFILRSLHLNKPPTLEQCAAFFKKGEQKSFTQFMATEMVSRRDLSPNTRKKDKTTLKHFTNFRKDVLFTELNIGLIRDFKNYLLQLGLAANSANSYHKRIKHYINIAIELEDGKLIDRNPYRKIKLKNTPVERFVLSQLQVEQIEALQFPPKEWHLEIKRDMFLVCCYLGLRYSDMIAIERNNFKKDHKGWWYMLKAQKTGKTIDIPLFLLFGGKPERLLIKYFEQTSTQQQRLFYPYADQTLNRNLKIIAQRAGIEQYKQVSTHTGRRTCATYLATVMDLSYVQTLLQHVDIRRTREYVQLNTRDLVRSLENVTW
ncbi:MAG: phage integrase SAM-like domain-containing protein [Aureispira sp.]